MSESIGDKPAFPLHNGDVWGGITYRQLLIGLLAAGRAGFSPSGVAEDAMKISDAIIARLDAEKDLADST